MKFFITGVSGRLDYDVLNELHKRDCEGIGSDIAETYPSVDDVSAVTNALCES